MSAVLFDYGGTLVDFSRPDAALRVAYARIRERLVALGQPAPPVETLLRDVHDRVEDEYRAHVRAGGPEEIDVVAASLRAYADSGIRLTRDELQTVLAEEQRAWWQGVHVRAGAVETLTLLRRAGIRTGICSNAPFVALHEQIEHLGLAEHLDAATFSATVRWRKPDPRMFAAALEALGAEAATTVMVGDSERDDIAGAHAVGMRAVLVRAGASHESSEADAVIDDLRALVPLLPRREPILDAHG